MSKFPFPRVLPRITILVTLAFLLAAMPGQSQAETAPGGSTQFTWVHRLRLGGHLALTYSPAGAFSADSSLLAVVEKERVALVDPDDGRVQKMARPRIPGVGGLDIQSANFISPTSLYLLASGLVGSRKGRGAPAAPELGFQWNFQQDAVTGKVSEIGIGGGFLPVRYFPRIGYLALYKDGAFTVWDPVTGRGGTTKLPGLTNAPQLFEFSPDGHWLLLAQIEMSATPNPVVVQLKDHKFVNVLAGHQGPVLGMMFSRNGRKVVTASADGDVRIYSVPDWKLVETLVGNRGPVHWADFSPDGSWVASAGQDQTVRVWSVATGKLLQTLSESQEPLLTVAFSPNGQYIAASSADSVHVWARIPVN
ncbi:MAG: WD40 repeat domain-containing protein [Terriglobia bacterium]